MNVSLSPQLAALIQRHIESGAYDSPAEVIREGLRVLEERDRIREVRLQHLREFVQVGIDQADRGQVRQVDPEAFLAEVHQRRAAKRKAGGQ